MLFGLFGNEQGRRPTSLNLGRFLITPKKKTTKTPKSKTPNSKEALKQQILLDGVVVDYKLVKNAKSRTIRITVGHDGVKVTVPIHYSHHLVENFLKEKSNWVLKALTEIKKKKQNIPKIKDQSVIPLLGKEKTIRINKSTQLRTKVSLEGSALVINCGSPVANSPGKTDQEKLEHTAKTALKKYLIEKSSKHLIERTAELASKMQVKYGTITIREQKSRWGSCSPQNNLNYNWKLIFYPPAVVDYVIIHELSHTVHHNHSSRFYSMVEKFCPDYRSLRRQLKSVNTPY